MDRREYLTLATGAAALLAVPVARAVDPALEHAAHEHHPHAEHQHERDAPSKALYDGAQDCVRTGQLCQAHCQSMLLAGDRTLADCSQSVSALIPVCQTLATLAAQQSAFLPHYARMAAEVCRACEKECRKHANEHSVCHDCAEACLHCAKNCDALAA